MSSFFFLTNSCHCLALIRFIYIRGYLAADPIEPHRVYDIRHRRIITRGIETATVELIYNRPKLFYKKNPINRFFCDSIFILRKYLQPNFQKKKKKRPGQINLFYLLISYFCLCLFLNFIFMLHARVKRCRFTF